MAASAAEGRIVAGAELLSILSFKGYLDGMVFCYLSSRCAQNGKNAIVLQITYANQCLMRSNQVLRPRSCSVISLDIARSRMNCFSKSVAISGSKTVRLISKLRCADQKSRLKEPSIEKIPSMVIAFACKPILAFQRFSLLTLETAHTHDEQLTGQWVHRSSVQKSEYEHPHHVALLE